MSFNLVDLNCTQLIVKLLRDYHGLMVVGISLGQGDAPSAFHGGLVEGAYAASVASRLAADHKIDMPVTDAVAAIIDGRLDIRTAMRQLMTRPITTE